MATDKSVATVKPVKSAGSPGGERARPQPAPARAARAPGPLQKAGKYLGEVRGELKKTTWPTKTELIAQTQVVVALLIALGVFIWVWDIVLTQILRGIQHLLGIKT